MTSELGLCNLNCYVYKRVFLLLSFDMKVLMKIDNIAFFLRNELYFLNTYQYFMCVFQIP